MLSAVLLMPWALIAHLTLTQCQKGECQPLQNAATTPRQIAVFDSFSLCDQYRRAITPRVTPAAQPQTTGTRTVHWQLTLTCLPGGTTP